MAETKEDRAPGQNVELALRSTGKKSQGLLRVSLRLAVCLRERLARTEPPYEVSPRERTAPGEFPVPVH